VSVERTPSGDWRVRWRDAAGRNRSKVVGPRKADASALDQEIKRAKRLGHLDRLMATEKTFSVLSQEWWQRHARTRARKTQGGYVWILDRYHIPQFGDLRLGEIRTPDVESGWQTSMMIGSVRRPKGRP
jgi:Phage integrase, N-terminal SAM-like domain